MQCPNCGGTVQPESNLCQKCGSYVEPESDKTQQQQQVPVQVIVQQQAPVSPQQAEAGLPSDKSKVAAGLLGIFLGCLGVHRFYLGYNGIGAAILSITIVGWILIATLFGACIGIPMVWATGLWGFIEGILILTGSISKDGQGRILQ